MIPDDLAALLPRVLVERLQLHGGGVPWSDREFGVVLFADISGFTALAERLADRGPDGADELARLLNLCFGRAVEIIAQHGGDIIRFAGDAPIALFRATWGSPASTAHEEAIERATACGLALQRAMEELRRAGTVDLSIRIGIGSGDTAAMGLGGVEHRHEFIVGGPSVTSAADALRLASRNEVVAAPAGLSEAQYMAVGPPPLVDPSLLRPFIPRSVLARLDAGHAAWIAELRRVSVMFLSIHGIDFAEDTACHMAQAAFETVQSAIYDGEGSINQFLVDDKGVMVLAAWGVPGRTHEDDAGRAIRAAQHASNRLRAIGRRSHAGIATGRVFCGWRGNASRREFALIGNIVSLAARLATTPDEGVLCDTATRDAAARGFEFESAGALALKGAAGPVPVFRPGVVARKSGGQLAGSATAVIARAVVGRAAERAIAERALADCLQGTGSTLVLEGEAGAGKSVLLEETMRLARERGVRILLGAGNSMTSAEPYYSWRSPLDDLLDLPSRAPAAERLALFAQRMASRPEIGERAPLLASPLGLPVQDTALTAQMTDTLRLENTRDLIVRLVDREAAAAPLMLVIDDAHWLDSASWALVLAAHRRAANLLLIIATRPSDEPPPELSEIVRTRTTVCRLKRLSDEEAVQLACRILGVEHLPSAVVRLLAAKAGGHPLFIAALTRALRDGGFITIDGNVCRLARDAHDLDLQQFPDTVQDVIAGWLDRLTPAQQLTIKVASVVGYAFSLRMLRDIHPVEREYAALRDQLASLDQLGLTLPETGGPDATHAFRHSVIHDVAYSLLVPSQRRELHRAAADWYEREDGGEPRYALLAHHWTRAEEHDRAVAALEAAGARASAGGAHRETIRFFQQALDLADGYALGVDELRRARWLCRLGQAHVANSAPDRGREVLDAALALVGRPLPNGRGALGLRFFREAARQAVHLMTPPRADPRRGDHAREAIEADVLEQLSSQAYFAQDPLLMMTSMLAAINTAERTGNVEAARRTYAGGGYVVSLLRLDAVARRWWRHAEQSRDPQVRAYALLSQTMHAIDAARWDEGERLSRRALAVARESGAHLTVHSALMMLMFAQSSPGDLEAGLATAREGLAVAEAANLEHRQIWSHHGISTQLLSKEDYAGAWVHTRHAIDLFADVTDPLTIATHYAHRIECVLLTRPCEEAAELAEKLSALIERYPPSMNASFNVYGWLLEFYARKWRADRAAARDVSGTRELVHRTHGRMREYARRFPIARPLTAMIGARIHALEGAPGRARTLLRQSLAYATRFGMPIEQGLAHEELGQLQPPGSRAALDHLGRAHSLFAAHGFLRHQHRVEATLRNLGYPART